MRAVHLLKLAGLVAVVCLAVVLGTTPAATATSRGAAKGVPAGPAPAAAPAECKKDADCTAVPDDCCSCGEGGSQRAVSNKKKDAYENQRTKRCAGTMCAQMMSTHPSCSQHAICAAGVCKLG